MNMDERIKRINELYHKSQSEGLTDEEKLEQSILRQEYVDSIKRNMKAQLDSIEIERPNGREGIFSLPSGFWDTSGITSRIRFWALSATEVKSARQRFWRMLCRMANVSMFRRWKVRKCVFTGFNPWRN